MRTQNLFTEKGFPSKQSRIDPDNSFNNILWVASIVNDDVTTMATVGLSLGHSVIVVEGLLRNGEGFVGIYEILYDNENYMQLHDEDSHIRIRIFEKRGAELYKNNDGEELILAEGNPVYAENLRKFNNRFDSWNNLGRLQCSSFVKHKDKVGCMMENIEAHQAHLVRVRKPQSNFMTRVFEMNAQENIAAFQTNIIKKGGRFDFKMIPQVNLHQLPNNECFLEAIDAESYELQYFHCVICEGNEALESILANEQQQDNFKFPHGKLVLETQEMKWYHFSTEGDCIATYQSGQYASKQERMNAIAELKNNFDSSSEHKHYLILLDTNSNKWKRYHYNGVKVSSKEILFDPPSAEKNAFLDGAGEKSMGSPEFLSSQNLAIFSCVYGGVENPNIEERYCQGDYFRMAQTVFRHDETVNCTRWAATQFKHLDIQIQDKKPKRVENIKCTIL